MADNTLLNNMTGGDSIADEDISGVKYQRMKLIDPTVGSTTPIGTTANPFKSTDPFKALLKPYAQVLTASTTITPTTGKGIQLCWIQVVPNSDNSTANLVTIQLTISGTLTTIYNVYALGRSAVFLGDVNTNLVITLANSQPVSVNLQYKEV